MSSVFCSLVTESIPVGDDAVVIRKLSPSALQDAQLASQEASYRQLQAIGGPAFLKEVRALNVTEDEVEETKERDPLLSYDAETLLRKGITSWTFDREKNDEAIADLDEDTQQLLATAVLKLSKPSLFTDKTGVEADRKNASPSSPAA